MSYDIRVQNVREVPTVKDGELSMEMEATFNVGRNGPFMVRMAKEGYSAIVMRQKMEERAREVEQITGTSQMK